MFSIIPKSINRVRVLRIVPLKALYFFIEMFFQNQF